eukprot:297434-Chlamydomonas_euryale.AAC.2
MSAGVQRGKRGEAQVPDQPGRGAALHGIHRRQRRLFTLALHHAVCAEGGRRGRETCIKGGASAHAIPMNAAAGRGAGRSMTVSFRAVYLKEGGGDWKLAPKGPTLVPSGVGRGTMSLSDSLGGRQGEGDN